MSAHSYLLYYLIVACEIAFWLILFSGLAVRYLLGRETLGRWMLYALLLVDILLLTFTAVDLRSGKTATLAHGLAAAYVGFAIAFGPVVIRWADSRFAHRFASGPAPVKAPTAGWPLVRHEFGLWLRCILACAITLGLIEGLVAWVGNEEATRPLLSWYLHALACAAFWLVFGPIWVVLFNRRAAA